MDKIFIEEHFKCGDNKSTQVEAREVACDQDMVITIVKNEL